MTRCRWIALAFLGLGLFADPRSVLRAQSTSPPTYTLSTSAGNFDPSDGPTALATGLFRPQGVAVDAGGNVYIADTDNQRIRKITSDGVIRTIAGTGFAGYSGDGGAATSASLYTPAAIALDASGNLYIADRDNSRIRKVTPDGTIRTVAGTGVPKFDGDGGAATFAALYHPTGVAVDSAGNLYIADKDNHRIRRVSTDGIIRTVAGTGTAGSSVVGNIASAAALSSPAAVALDASGNLFIADTGNHRVLQVTPDGVIRTSAGTGAAGFSGDGGAATAAALRFPNGVAVDKSGNLYISDRDNNRLRRVTTDGIIRTVAGNGTFGFGGDGGAATAAALYSPYGVAVDGNGNLYLADHFNSRIRKITPAGVISTIAGNGSVGFAGDGGQATAASLYYPAGVAVDASGSLYIADSDNNRIRKVTPDGIIRTVAGNGDDGFGGDGGQATSASINNPQGVAVDGSGNLYIADTGNNRIRRVTTNGVIQTFAGTQRGGFGGEDGPATSASLSSPLAVAVDAAGNVYIADSDNHRIRRVTRDGTITTIAGTGRAGFNGDIAAASASLNSPSAVTLDGSGILYIADTANHRIRKLASDGFLRTVAGNGTEDFSGDGGSALSATLGYPTGVAVDGAGNVYIADTENNRIRQVTTDGFIQTVAGNARQGFSGDGPATSASLSSPEGMAVDKSGNLFLADAFNHRVRRLSQGTTCPYIITPSQNNIAAPGGSASVSVTAPSGCTWTASSNASWISIVSGAIGTGSGTVNCSVQANTSTSPRTGALTIAGQIFTVNQAGFTPALFVSPVSLSFNVPSGAPAQTQTVRAGSVGVFLAAGVLTSTSFVTPFSVAITGGNWLKVTPTLAFTTAVLAVTADPSGLAPDTYTATITLTSAEASNSPRIPVTLIVTPPPKPLITLSPAAFAFSFQAGGDVPAPSLLSITTSGAPVNYTVAASTNDGGTWLRVSNASGAAPGLVDLSIATAGLTSGTYSGRITVSSPDAGNSPQSVPVTLTVTSPAITSSLVVSPQAGLDFNYQINGLPPPPQNLFVASSGDPIQFSVTASNAGLVRWLSAQPAQGTTNAILAVAADPASLPAGTYEGSVAVTGAGQTVTISVRLTVTQRVQPILETDTAQLTWSTPTGVPPPPSQVRVNNPGTDVVTFDVQTITDDNSNWLTISKTRAGADWQNPATLVVAADPTGLSPGVYSGRVEIRAPQQAPIVIPAALAVSAGKKLVLSQNSMSFVAAAGRAGSALPQDLSVLSVGGDIAWTARVVAGANWLSLAQGSGSVSSGALNRIQVNINSQGLAAGEYHGEIDFDSPDVDNRPEKVTVLLVVRSAASLPPAAVPAGVAFATTAGSNPAARDVTILYTGAGANARWTASVSLDPDSPADAPLWLKLDKTSGTFTDLAGTATNLSLRVLVAGLTPGFPYRATVYLTISGNVPVNVPVLLVVAPASGGQRAASAACVPTTWLPQFTTLQQYFSVSNGQAAATELVILDDCGNAVTTGSVGGRLSSGDRPFDLISLGDGSWRATWVPRRAPGSVTMNIVATDGSVQGNAPPISGLVSGSINGPVLDARQPILAPDGTPQLAIAPGSVFRIQGSNLTSTVGPTKVTLGNSVLTVQFVSANTIIAVVPDDVAVNRNLPLVVQVGDSFSAPETVLVAATWPVTLSSAMDAAGQVTMEATGVARARNGDVIRTPQGPIRIHHIERLSPGIFRVLGKRR